ncbi:MAG: hypothetical protein R3E12_18025 [Candidatus Eisenbacteria bacterium]|uniref:Uncharacterized protein n=1 Tax=Eiseniibacteriota bacterium TaxID=2212470 RepID=A0A956M286_UNCEI|nr:hypothetical protein [Candidatus Eisenbacteria bacterium]
MNDHRPPHGSDDPEELGTNLGDYPWFPTPRGLAADVLERWQRREILASAPARASREHTLQPDVRASDEAAPALSGTDAGPFSRSCLFAGGEVSVEASRTGTNAWTIAGTVWLEAEDAEVRLALIAGDHVVAATRVGNGEVFRFDEFLAPPWSIELHYGSGEALVVATHD